MPETERITLIIDGHNLAYHLSNFDSSRALAIDEVFSLAVHLRRYAQSAHPPVVIELCFDPLPPDAEIPALPWVRCLVAPAGSSADDLLRERFRYHHHQKTRSVVITNDGEIRDNVEEEGGESLLVYDFVRRGGKSPIFRQPGEFKAIHSHRAAPPSRKKIELDWDRLSLPASEPTSAVAISTETPVTPTTPVEGSDDAALETPDASMPLPEPTEPASPPELIYRLAFENWPHEKGLQFLLGSFCRQHQQDEDWQLFQALPPEDIHVQDLRDLAGLLRKRCGAEPTFAREGSLLKRVRQALVLADDFQLNLSEISARTGLNRHSLQGRIREKADPWIEIIRP